MKVIKITSQNFEEEVINSEKTVLLDFYADWCQPCKMMSPIIDSIAEEMEDIKVGKVNIDENQTLAIKYNIMNIPTIILLDKGEVSKRFVGVRDKEEIINELK